MPFVAEEEGWIRAHYFSVPEQIQDFCGDLTGKSVLDVGCGDMLSDFGLLRYGVSHVTGLDLADKPTRTVHLPQVRQRIMQQGISVGEDYENRMTYLEYDGEHFPFPDETFDLVISWSAFEHITEVSQVLREINRVCRRNGMVFIQVYPWYHSWPGSHLTDYISEPYFHLKRSPEWVYQQLNDYVARHPEAVQSIFQNMWPEYNALNGYSADRFYAAVIAAGFKVRRCSIIAGDQDLTEAPSEIPLSDLLIFGTKMLLHRKDIQLSEGHPRVLHAQADPIHDLTVALHDRETALADIRNSWSWRLTEPMRRLGALWLRSRLGTRF